MEQKDKKVFKVRTRDGEEFSVSYDALSVSKYFADYLEDREDCTQDEVLDISEFS